MGNCIPKSLRLSATQKHAILTRYDRIRKVLLFTEEELWVLYCAFINANKNESGYLSEDALFAYLDFDGGLFAHRVFRMFKDQSDGEISFNGFLLTCWSVCTRDKNNLANFAFQLYDIQGRGELGLSDVRLFLSEVFGPRFEQHKAGNAVYHSLVRFDYQNTPLEAHVDPVLFRTLSQNHPLLLFPAFELQQKLINKTLKDNWDLVTDRRDKAVKSKKFDIMNVVVLANEGRQRRGSVVPISDRHLLNLLDSGISKNDESSLTGNNNTNIPPGLRTSSKIIPEPDYRTLQNKLNSENNSSSTNYDGTNGSSSLVGKVVDGVQQIIDDPKGTMGQVISTTKTAARRASIQVSAGMQNALQYAGITDNFSPPVPVEMVTNTSGRRTSMNGGINDDNNTISNPVTKQRRNSVMKTTNQSRRISTTNTFSPTTGETVPSSTIIEGSNDNEALFAPRGRRRQSISLATTPVIIATETLNDTTEGNNSGLISTSNVMKVSRRIVTNIPIAMANDDNNGTPIDDEQPLLAPRGRRNSHFSPPGTVPASEAEYQGTSPVVTNTTDDNNNNNNYSSKPKERRTSIVKNNPGQRRGSNGDTYVQAQRRASLVH